MFIQFECVYVLLIRQSGNIETNPGPRPNPSQSFWICYGYLNK